MLERVGKIEDVRDPVGGQVGHGQEAGRKRSEGDGHLPEFDTTCIVMQYCVGERKLMQD